MAFQKGFIGDAPITLKAKPQFRRVLITGATGLLGSRLVRLFEKPGRMVHAWCRHPARTGNVVWCSVDLENSEEVSRRIDEISPDLIVHTAAWTKVDQCEQDPGKAYKIHVESSRTIAEWGNQNKARMIYISTDSVFSSNHFGPFFREDDPVNPVNTYARSKWDGEEAVKAAAENFLILRTNFFGKSPLISSNSLADWAIKTLASGQDLPGFNDVWFNPLHVGTLGSFIVSLAESSLAGIVHLGSKNGCSKLDFLRELARLWGYPSERVFGRSAREIPTAARRPHFTCLDVNKAEGLLGQTMPTFTEELIKLKQSWI